MDYGSMAVGKSASPENPGGMMVHSQGRKPLERERTQGVNAEGVAVILPPFQG
jgi:hypothetical protein